MDNFHDPRWVSRSDTGTRKILDICEFQINYSYSLVLSKYLCLNRKKASVPKACGGFLLGLSPAHSGHSTHWWQKTGTNLLQNSDLPTTFKSHETDIFLWPFKHPLPRGRVSTLGQPSTLFFLSIIKTHINEILMMFEDHALIQCKFE